MSDDLPTLDSPKEPVRRRAFGFQRTPTHVHNGIDLPAPEGTPVYAAELGDVVHAYNAFQPGFSGYGKVVVVRDLDGVFTLYAHLKRPLVSIGDRVEAGARIGEVGKTGYTSEDPYKLLNSGPHLHFEASANPYRQHDTEPRLDPVQYLRAGRVHPLLRTRFGGGDVPEPTPVSEGNSDAGRPFVAPQARGAFLRLSGVCPHCRGSFSCVAHVDDLEAL